MRKNSSAEFRRRYLHSDWPRRPARKAERRDAQEWRNRSRGRYREERKRGRNTDRNRGHSVPAALDLRYAREVELPILLRLRRSQSTAIGKEVYVGLRRASEVRAYEAYATYAVEGMALGT